MAKPEDNFNKRAVWIIPPSHIVNYAYNASLQYEYMGHAVRGSSDSDDVWTIRKYTYNANKTLANERVAHNVAWDDRLTASYE